MVKVSEDRIRVYLQRLTGSQPDGNSPIRLSSAQKAAFAAWLRQAGIPFSPAVLQQPTFFLEALSGATTVSPLPVRPPAMPRSNFTLLSNLRVGIDMELTSSLPDADDYRVHEFYRDNFTPGEIAYCLQRIDPKGSLCGLWAAKEAALKALGGDSTAGLRAIEIEHDANGRPFCSLGEVSISHAGGSCVAIFVTGRAENS